MSITEEEFEEKVSEAADWADGFPPALQERYNELAESVEE